MAGDRQCYFIILKDNRQGGVTAQADKLIRLAVAIAEGIVIFGIEGQDRIDRGNEQNAAGGTAQPRVPRRALAVMLGFEVKVEVAGGVPICENR